VNGSQANRAIELVALHRDGHEFPVEATVWPVHTGGILCFNAFVRDISERRRAEDARKKETTLVQLLQSMTMAANRSSSIEHTARVCLDQICTFTGWPVGHFYLRSKNLVDGLTSAGYCHGDDDGRYTTFRDATIHCRYALDVGLPGSVLASAKPQWIVDLADEEPQSERTCAAVEAGLRSGFGFPMVVEDQVIGVLEFFSPQTAQPDEEFLTIMGHIGTQLGQVIRRQRAEEDLRDAKASAESANRAIPAARNDHQLKALAIKKNQIHVVGAPSLKFEGVPTFLDVEGMPDRNFYYLVGLRFERDGEHVERSFWADGFERMIPHLAARDTTLVAISRAPLQKLDAFKARMGWTFDWLSSADDDFNYDYGVSFTPEQIKSGDKAYNFGTSGFSIEDAPGISVFFRDEAGNIFHTYSCFARGLDMMNAAYHYLDLTPMGRHEEGLPYPMDWLRLRDQYQPASGTAACCQT
jgi:hypothetical protein